MSFAKTPNTGGKSDPVDDNEDAIPGEGIVGNARKKARRRGKRGKGKGAPPVVRNTKPGVSVSDDFGTGDSNSGEGSTALEDAGAGDPAPKKKSGASKLRKALSALSKRGK